MKRLLHLCELRDLRASFPPSVYPLPGNLSKDFPEHARRCLGGVDRMDQLRSIVVEQRLCFGLISIQPFPDDGFIGVIEAVVLERAFLETLGQLGAVGTA